MCAPLARMSSRASTRIGRKPTSSSWSAATPPGAIRCCISALLAARAARGTKVIVLDPRRTATAEAADLHLPLAPGSDVALFNGLLAYLAATARSTALDGAPRTTGFADGSRRPRGEYAARPRMLAADCGLEPVASGDFLRLVRGDRTRADGLSQGVNQSASGTDKVNAIINCHLATGRIGRPGMGPFSVTGQPNAMGGREVGGLANQLAAHMQLRRPRRSSIACAASGRRPASRRGPA